MKPVLTILAFATLTGFLGILVYAVPRLDLAAVVVIVLLLAAYDIFIAPKPSS